MNRNFFKIDRRKFLLGSCCLALNGVSSRVFSASHQYNGPLWLFINADGGWDPTSLCDPKGFSPQAVNASPRINNYSRNDIQQTGNISYAPPPDDFRVGGLHFDSTLFSAQNFFEKYFDRLLVINGVDSDTNSHADGQLYNLSGRLRKDTPCLAALIAAAVSPESSLSFITFGGYSESAEVITPVRMNNSALNAMFEIAHPNRSFNPKVADGRVYLPDNIQNLIHRTSQDRHQAMLNQQFLPGVRTALKKLISNRATDSSLQSYADNLLTTPAKALSSFNFRKKAYSLYLQGRLALASFQEGMTVSANIVMSGFDTHAKHDETHYPLLMDFLQGIDAILDEAALRGLSDRIVLVITSDFGRTPFYNQLQGKDHWPIGSVMLMGNSMQKIPGNRVIGATSDALQAISLNPVTLQLDPMGLNPLSQVITPTSIHQAIRRLAGIEAHQLSLLYPLEGNEINLFS